MSDRDPRDMRDTPDVGFGMGGMGGGNGKIDLLMMQVNELTSKLGTIQNENMQLRHSMSSLPHPPMYGAGYSGTNGPMPMPTNGGLVTTFAPPAGSMMQGISAMDQARASQRFANTRHLSRSRERLLDEGDDLEGGPNMTRINDSVLGGGMVGQGGTTTTDWVTASGVTQGEARRMARQPGSLAQWLETSATPVERQHLIDFVQVRLRGEGERGKGRGVEVKCAGGLFVSRLRA